MSVITVDATGTRCPAPILAIAKALRENPAEDKFHLISDDPATNPDIQAWARMTGNGLAIIDSKNFEVTRRQEN